MTSSGTFGPLSSYTPITLAGVVPDDMLIVNTKFLYVPMGDTTVTGYMIDRSTGGLTAIAGSPFTVPGGVGTADDVASDPLGRFLFVGSETASAIWVFLINSDHGGVNTDNGITVLGRIISGRRCVIFLRWMLLASFFMRRQINPSLGVGGFNIDQTTGALTPMTGSPFTGVSVAQISCQPDGRISPGSAGSGG